MQADDADSRDSVHPPQLLRGLRRHLRTNELPLRELLADAGYANGPNYPLPEALHIMAWIPVFGKYKSEDDGFRYDALTDSYQCPAGKHLRFQMLDTASEGGWVKRYRTAARECLGCPLKASCLPQAPIDSWSAPSSAGPTAVRGSASRATGASACGGPGKARSSPCLGA